MARSKNGPPGPLYLLVSGLLFAASTQARQVMYTWGTDLHGVTRELPANRDPALYTGDYGDCLGGQSLLKISKLDAAYYADNMTIVLHLDGTSNAFKNESLMMRIAVDACTSLWILLGGRRYIDTSRLVDGENRLDMIINPCHLNIASLCPLLENVPVQAWAEIRVGPQQVGGIPEIAYEIPDLEGTTQLQLFSNRTESQIACFQAPMKNGKSVAHAYVIAPVLGAFTLVAILGSFLSAVYGVSVPHMRMHHAHSLSVLVVFETFQTIFLSGMFSVAWPSILVAWRTNFAWAAGFVDGTPFVRAVHSFAGTEGNASQLGSPASTDGSVPSNIYAAGTAEQASQVISKRSTLHASDPWAYEWGGDPVLPGFPLPGTWFGFPATLAAVDVPAAGAFLVGLIWFAIAVGAVLAAVGGLKLVLEVSASLRWIKEGRLAYFRTHWVGFLCHGIMRTLVVGFGVLMTLTMFQLTIRSSLGPMAVASVLFFLLLMGMLSFVAYACRARTRHGTLTVSPDRVVVYRATTALRPAWESTAKEQDWEVRPVFRIPLRRIRYVHQDPDRLGVHEDAGFVKRFSWLTGRYRRTRWWFLAYCLAYRFCRAALLGGARQTPRAQVYGVLVVDILNFAVTVILNPWEGERNTAMAVWILNICKVITGGISIAFLPSFDTNRMVATVLGIIIIVIQGCTVLALLILIILSAISTRFSLLRNREDVRPPWLDNVRIRYFEKMETKAQDQRQHPLAKVQEEDIKEPAPLTKPPFSVAQIRRNPKIEDEQDSDDDTIYEAQNRTGAKEQHDAGSRGPRGRAGQTCSVRSARLGSGSLPRGGRVSRMSWSSRDFGDASLDRPDSTLARRLSGVTFAVGMDGTSSMSKHGSIMSGSSSAVVRPQNSYRSFRTTSSSGSTPTRESFTASPLPCLEEMK
ncbi:putative flavin carrier protein 2 precursor [Podospora australis]|uniref:Flavin carrier protein 2 n=1 Tax=Podospora australis TaxID=1536484 RepID=A0AAN6WVV1_9PEZI|nr:putative flavin carrier protein 2 precursor [Podospora australis]